VRYQNFSTRQHECYSALYAIVRPSICPSVCHTGGSVKMVEVMIMQLSPQSRPMTLVSSWFTSLRNSKGNIGSEGAK